MKKALISTIEPRQFFDGSSGYRVAQVEPQDNTFGVSNELYWMDCGDDVVADQFYFDTSTNEIKPVPIAPPSVSEDQPITNGTQ